jgi:WD40 repeat protein
LWDVTSGKQVAPLNRPADRLTKLAVSPDGKIVVGIHASGLLGPWDAPTRKSLPNIPTHVLANTSAIWSADGRQLAFAQDALVSVCDVHGPSVRHIAVVTRAGSTAREPSPRRARSPAGVRLALQPPLASHVDIHDARTGERLQVLTRTGSNVRAGAWSPDGKRFASTADGRGQKLLIHEVASGKLLRSSADGKAVLAAGFLNWSPDGKVLASVGEFAGSGPNKVLLWDPDRSPLAPRLLAGHEASVRAVLWSPKGTLLASTSFDNTLRLWKPSGEPAGKLFPHGRVTSIRWLAEDRLLTIVEDGTFDVWNVQRSKSERTVNVKTRFGPISPDGRTLAAIFWTALRLLDLESGRPRGTLCIVRPGSPDLWLALSPDGHYVGPPGVEREIVYVAQTAAGQETLSPEDFCNKHGWKNDPQRVRLVGE